MEEWKIISGHSNYSISNYGRVRNDKKGTFLKPTIIGNGYQRVSLNGKLWWVHRLVALAFVKNPYPNLFNVVNHLDQNPSNNHFSNLEWCDDYGNLHYSKIARKEIEERIDYELLIGKICLSKMNNDEIAGRLGITRMSLFNKLNKKTSFKDKEIEVLVSMFGKEILKQ